jgi:hypothetical protein
MSEPAINPKDKPEYIVCAAIHYRGAANHCYEHQPVNIDYGYVVTGLRHHNCINMYYVLTGRPSRSADCQGFLTSKNRFVDRQEAAEIAYQAGQTAPKHASLHSEDLY